MSVCFLAASRHDCKVSLQPTQSTMSPLTFTKTSKGNFMKDTDLNETSFNQQEILKDEFFKTRKLSS